MEGQRKELSGDFVSNYYIKSSKIFLCPFVIFSIPLYYGNYLEKRSPKPYELDTYDSFLKETFLSNLMVKSRKEKSEQSEIEPVHVDIEAVWVLNLLSVFKEFVKKWEQNITEMKFIAVVFCHNLIIITH